MILMCDHDRSNISDILSIWLALMTHDNVLWLIYIYIYVYYIYVYIYIYMIDHHDKKIIVIEYMRTTILLWWSYISNYHKYRIIFDDLSNLSCLDIEIHLNPLEIILLGKQGPMWMFTLASRINKGILSYCIPVVSWCSIPVSPNPAIVFQFLNRQFSS